MDHTALYVLTHVRAIVQLRKLNMMPAEEVWRQVYMTQMKARDVIDNPLNTLAVPAGTRALVSELHQALFPVGDKLTWEQRVMMIEVYIREEIERCVGAKFIWPHMYDEEALKLLGFNETNIEGFYQVPYYMIDHLSRDSLLFFMDGNFTTTIERSEPLQGYGPDQSGMLPLGMYALGAMPDAHKHHFFLETN
ncbi:hypothetical protein YOLOSWAG_291 [Erwinia phage vB_EamM_Yoloswag]|uniref:Uncharacterized protein n=1 Tax=Erwinia phage vB_EamM_Yoloswag TaxID=1958956 RepID=A0A1S6L3J9_9CAUD|nr:hypothetical protein HOR66_gp291 [Erwinia phage vB_EamM_Yoloswag]AQT28761.1 hypothetical protein YOLOSWAG_291 [Erwinia phage vB_EamM_Yoloswag]